MALPAQLYVLSLLANRHINQLYSYSLITVLVDTVLFVLLTSLFGLHGAVTAKILTAFASAVIAWLLHNQKNGSHKLT